MIQVEYQALPESVCRELRGGRWLGAIEDDVPNFCLRIAGQRVEYCDAHDYLNAWRKSGLWTLYGREG